MSVQSILSIILALLQVLFSFIPAGTTPPQNEGINFESVKSAYITGEYALGDKNPIITITLENTSATSNVDADMFELTGLFSELEITKATQSTSAITLITEGEIPYSIPLSAGVNISEKATKDAVALSAQCELVLRDAYIKQDSFTFADGRLSFTMQSLNNAFTCKAGDTLESNGLTFTVKALSDNGSAITLDVPLEADSLDNAISQIDGFVLTIPADKLSSGAEQAITVYANEASFGATFDYVKKADEENTFNASAILFIKNGDWASDLTTEDISLGGAFEGATITGLTKKQNAYVLDFSFVKENINLNKVTLNGIVTIAEGKIKNAWGTTLPERNAALDYVTSGLNLDGYKQITAFIPAQTGIFDTISSIGGYVGTAAGIASGVYSVLGMLGVVENTNAKIDDTRRIIKEVQEAISALDEKLDKMGSTITTGTIETMSAIQYNTYVTASGNWDHFLGAYVTPFENEITEFEMAYNDYMLNFIMNAHSDLHSVTVWKDVDGNVTFPHPANGSNSTLYSIDGKVLASTDTYNLVAELKGVQAKVMQNGGRLYNGYWEDVIAEMDDKQFESMFVNVTKDDYLDAVQLNATLHALEAAGATDILNAYTNLCGAIAGDGSAGGLKPIDNYLTMLSMYYNFYIESSKDIDTTLTWLYSLLTRGAFISTLAYNFTPSAETDIVNKAFDKAANQITKASAKKDPYYSYIANKVVTVSEITQYEYNSTQGLYYTHETDLYLGSCWDGNLIQPNTFKAGTYMDTVQLSLMYKRYEYLLKSGVCDDPSFSHYVVSLGLVDNSALFDYLTPMEAIIVASPISLEDIPLDNSFEMTITRIYHSTWQKKGDVISIGTQGKLSKEYFTAHFKRCANTMDFNGNITDNKILLAQAYYDEDHWYWGSWAIPEEWTCIIMYDNPMFIFTLS